MICQQEIQLVIDPPGFDPADFFWTGSEAHFPGFTSASFFPNAASGASFQVTAQSLFSFSANAIVTGVTTYNGPAMNLSFDGVTTKNGPGGFSYIGVLQISITLMGTTIYVLILNNPAPPPGGISMPAGTDVPFSIPFTVPDTGGNVATLTVEARVHYNLAGGPYELKIDGTISVV